MQKIFLSIVFLILPLMSIGSVFAATTTTVIVTEKVPGANCVPYGGWYRAAGAEQDLTPADAAMLMRQPWTTMNSDGSFTLSDKTKINATTSLVAIQTRKYECTVGSGLAGFQAMFAEIIRWFVNIVMILGVLAIVGLGIAWSLAWGDDAKAKTGLKKWAMNIFVGMIILFFFRYILQFLAPWIYQ